MAINASVALSLSLSPPRFVSSLSFPLLLEYGWYGWYGVLLLLLLLLLLAGGFGVWCSVVQCGSVVRLVQEVCIDRVSHSSNCLLPIACCPDH